MADASTNVNGKKSYTLKEIEKIAPNYKGKPENFDPARVGKKKPKPCLKMRTSEKLNSREQHPPKSPQTKATAQRFESIISEAIFGADIRVIEIASRQYFSPNYSKVVDIAEEVYNSYRADEGQLERVLAREEMAYYATAALYLKLLEVKAKQGDIGLTSAEEEMREAVNDDIFNIPQPIYAYLNEIGIYRDKMQKEIRLPTIVVQNFGGYHAAEINVDTHNLFEELPSLGIAGDMVMALASPDAEPLPNFHIGKPAGSVFTENLIGKFYPIGLRRPEIAQRLAGYGITAAAFAEYIPGTRFNPNYLRSLSDIVGKFKTFEIEKVTFKNLKLAGGETQIIKTRPIEPNDQLRWNQRNVQATSATTNSTTHMGAAYCFGFQLYKEDGTGVDRNARITNWSCVISHGQNPWIMPDDWYKNRNDRRNLPNDVDTEMFRAISMRQDIQLSNVVRRMIKTLR